MSKLYLSDDDKLSVEPPNQKLMMLEYEKLLLTKRVRELEEALREITYISSDGHIYVGVREDISIDEYAVIRSLHEKPVTP